MSKNKKEEKVRESEKSQKGFLGKAFSLVTKSTVFVIFERLAERGLESVIGKDIRWHFGENGKWGVSLEEFESNIVRTDDPAYIVSNSLDDNTNKNNVIENENLLGIEEPNDVSTDVSTEIMTDESDATVSDELVFETEVINSDSFVETFVDNTIDLSLSSNDVVEKDLNVVSESENVISDYESYIHDMALRTYRGEFGNGQVRKDLLGDEYSAIQHVVNEKYYGIDDGYDERVMAAENIVDTETIESDMSCEI